MAKTPHPGQEIRARYLKPRGLTVTAAAALMKVDRSALSTMLSGKSDLTAQMAFRIERVFGADMTELMQMQVDYDVEKTRKLLKGLGIKRLEDLKISKPVSTVEVVKKKTEDRDLCAA